MRITLTMAVIAASVGCFANPAALAAPAYGTGLGTAAAAVDITEKAYVVVRRPVAVVRRPVVVAPRAVVVAPRCYWRAGVRVCV